MQSRVFVSYRHRDSAAHVHALRARLASRLGAARVFMDVGAIELGADFLTSIRTAIAGGDMLIAVIGPGWASGLSGKIRPTRALGSRPAMPESRYSASVSPGPGPAPARRCCSPTSTASASPRCPAVTPS